MTYERQSPDYTHEVRACRDRHPIEWEAARERPDGSRDDRFIRLLAWELAQLDPLVGLNGKRGGRDISTDALSYHNQTAPGGVEVIDVIVGATHSPSWQDATLPPMPDPKADPNVPEGVLGRYVAPTRPAGATSPPAPGASDPPEQEPGDDPVVNGDLERIADGLERLADVAERVIAAGGALRAEIELTRTQGIKLRIR